MRRKDLDRLVDEELVQPGRAARALVKVTVRGPNARSLVVHGIAEVDTGGTHTFIAPSVVRQLGLKRIGQKLVRGIGGSGQRVGRYAVRLTIADVTVPMVKQGVYVHPSLDTRHDKAIVLVGRDFLAGGDGLKGLHITYDGPSGRVRVRPSRKPAGARR